MKEILLEELRFSAGLALSNVEVVPRFRILTPEGDFTVFVPLPDNIGERQRRMQLVYGFMAWKSATAFVLSSELVSPEAIISAGVGFGDVMAAARALTGKPRVMGPVEWLGGDSVGEEVKALLPRGRVNVDGAALVELERVFSQAGEFPVRRNN